ncbi:hypothetical protein CRENBAI_000940 [Crenichthys baileyi]|uniref:Uncharacterized protein n=1 Tax=Crenichthys baileyi TaxID=28760 RepID=A0AAV9R1Y2_9TELE
MATAVNVGVDKENPKLCPCGNKMSLWDTHSVCAACLGVVHARTALTSTEECIHCASFPPCSRASPSWAHTDPQLMPSTFPLLQTDEVCDGLAISRSFPEGDGDEDGAELDDSELMLSDDEDEDSTILVSRRGAVSPEPGCANVWPQELLDAVTWRDKPYTERHPIAGGSLLDCEGMEAHGLHQMPPVEPLVVSHLHPKTSYSSTAASLPFKTDRF